jgi:citrate synthase
MYSYDELADDTSISNVLRQSLNLISQFPMLMVYGYHAYNFAGGFRFYDAVINDQCLIEQAMPCGMDL